MADNLAYQEESRSSRSAWIEIHNQPDKVRCHYRRAPRGARGLKSFAGFCSKPLLSRAPRGARGLKFEVHLTNVTEEMCRAPRGARGLKYCEARVPDVQLQVALLAERVD